MQTIKQNDLTHILTQNVKIQGMSIAGIDAAAREIYLIVNQLQLELAKEKIEKKLAAQKKVLSTIIRFENEFLPGRAERIKSTTAQIRSLTKELQNFYADPVSFLTNISDPKNSTYNTFNQYTEEDFKFVSPEEAFTFIKTEREKIRKGLLSALKTNENKND